MFENQKNIFFRQQTNKFILFADNFQVFFILNRNNFAFRKFFSSSIKLWIMKADLIRPDVFGCIKIERFSYLYMFSLETPSDQTNTFFNGTNTN